jgi:hypothetical protein
VEWVSKPEKEPPSVDLAIFIGLLICSPDHLLAFPRILKEMKLSPKTASTAEGIIRSCVIVVTRFVKTIDLI